jgi:hypothetical protein
MSSGVAEVGDKGLLLRRFDRFVTVAGPYPGHGARGRIAAQDGEAGQSRAGATMTSNASNLDVLPGPRSFQNGLEPLDNVLGAYRHAEIWPIDVAVIPRWLPVSGEIQAIVGTADTCVRSDRVKRRCCEVRAVRQHDQVKVTMRLEHAMLVNAVATLGRLPFSVPIEPTVGTKHNVAELDHHTTLGQTEGGTRPRSSGRSLLWRDRAARGHGLANDALGLGSTRGRLGSCRRAGHTRRRHQDSSACT